jgi:hypothetical protein
VHPSGKATLFVANQNTLDALPEPTIKALTDETDALLESNKALTTEIKAASTGNERPLTSKERANPPTPATELATLHNVSDPRRSTHVLLPPSLPLVPVLTVVDLLRFQIWLTFFQRAGR